LTWDEQTSGEASVDEAVRAFADSFAPGLVESSFRVLPSNIAREESSEVVALFPAPKDADKVAGELVLEEYQGRWYAAALHACNAALEGEVHP
jgi:hypothetical protein